jgi:hypothetical protein
MKSHTREARGEFPGHRALAQPVGVLPHVVNVLAHRLRVLAAAVKVLAHQLKVSARRVRVLAHRLGCLTLPVLSP